MRRRPSLCLYTPSRHLKGILGENLFTNQLPSKFSVTRQASLDDTKLRCCWKHRRLRKLA